MTSTHRSHLDDRNAARGRQMRPILAPAYPRLVMERAALYVSIANDGGVEAREA